MKYLLILLLFVLCSCQSSDKPSPKPSSDSVSAQTLDQLWAQASIGEQIPDQALALFVVPGMHRLLQHLGTPQLRQQIRFQALFKSLGRRSESLIGYDPFDLNGIRAMGIDPNGLFGGVWFSLQPLVYGTFVHIHDPKAFENYWTHRGATLQNQIFVLKEYPQLSILFSPDRHWAWFLINDREQKFAHQLLKTQNSWKKQYPHIWHKDKALNSDTVVVFNMASLRTAFLSKNADHSIGKLWNDLPQAGLIVFDLHLNKKNINFEVHFNFNAQAHQLSHLLKAKGHDAAPIPSQNTILWLSAWVDPEVAWCCIHRIGEALGYSIEEIVQTWSKTWNIDLQRDLLPSLDGRLAFALNGKILDRQTDLPQAFQNLQLTIVLGLSQKDFWNPWIQKGKLEIPGWTSFDLQIKDQALWLQTKEILPSPPNPIFQWFDSTPQPLRVYLSDQWFGTLTLLSLREQPVNFPSKAPAHVDPQTYAKVLQELQAIQDQIKPLEREKYNLLESKALQNLSHLGNLIFEGHFDGHELVIRAQFHFPKHPLPQVMEQLLEITWSYITELKAGLSAKDRTLRKLKRKERKVIRKIQKMLRD